MSDIETRARDLFLQALDQQPDQIAGFLDDSCVGDDELRQRVQKLLDAHEQAGNFLAPSHMDETVIKDADEADFDDFPETTASSKPRPGTAIGPYKLLEQIGEGGMGSVWVASQSQPIKRKVAIKLIKAGMDSGQVLARFEAERQALAMMDHPNIARVLDGGMTEHGRPYFAMEYVKGVPLTEYCDHARLSVRERLELFVPICQAVQHAHQKGIIHRDLKPSNILVCLYDGRPVPKVIDFGLAKAMHQSLTEHSLYTAHGMMVGTPLYMSPEQAEHNNLDIDTRTDVYALGVILYELLTGTTPLEKAQMKEAAYNEVLRLIKEVEPPKPSTRVSGSASLPSVAAQRSIEPGHLKRSISGDLDWVVMKALEKERSRRYETANGLAEDIRRHLSDEPVSASPPSTSYRMRKFIRRNKTVVVAAGAIAVTLLLGVAGTTGGMFWALEERKDAVSAREAESKARREAVENAAEALRLADAETEARQQEAVARKLADANMMLATQAQKEAEAERDAARRASDDSARRLAQTWFERGQGLCERGEIPIGLHWQAKSLTTLPDDSDDLENAIRLSISHWRSHLTPLRFYSQGEIQADTSNCVIRPDGKLIVTVGHGRNFVETFDASSGKLLGKRLQQPHTLFWARFSADGTRIITNATDNTALVWDAHTFEPVGKPLEHRGGTAALSPDGKIALTGNGQGNVRFWNTSTGESLADAILDLQGGTAVDISPNGQTAAVLARSKSIDGAAAQLLDMRTYQPLGQPFPVGDKPGRPVFSPDSIHFAANTLLGNTVGVWDATTGRLVTKTMPHQSVISDIAFSPDGRLFATACDDATVQFWDAATGERVSYPLKHHIAANGVSFTPDGEGVATYSDDGALRLWGTPRSSPLASTLRQRQSKDDNSARFSLQGDTLLASQGKTITFLNANTGEAINAMTAGDTIRRLALAGDGRTVLAAISKDRAESFQLATRRWAWEQNLDQNLFLDSVTFSQGGDTILLAFAFQGILLKPNIQILDAATGSPVKVIKTIYPLHSAAFLPDGKSLLAGGSEGTPRFYRVDSGEQFGPEVRLHPGGVQCIAFTPDSRHVITGGRDETAKVWEAETGKVVSTMLHAASVEHVAISPDGQFVITGAVDGAARFWDVRTGKPLGPPLKNSAPVRLVAFRDNGATALVAYADGLVKLWQAPSPMQGTPAEIVDWVNVATGTELRDDNTRRVLTWKSWNEKAAAIRSELRQ